MAGTYGSALAQRHAHQHQTTCTEIKKMSMNVHRTAKSEIALLSVLGIFTMSAGQAFKLRHELAEPGQLLQ